MVSSSLLQSRAFNALDVNRLSVNRLKVGNIDDNNNNITFDNLSKPISEKYLGIMQDVVFHSGTSFEISFSELCDPSTVNPKSNGCGINIAHNATTDTSIAGGIKDSAGNTYYASFWSSSLFKFNPEGELVDATISSVVTKIPNTALIGLSGIPSVYPPGDTIRALAALDDFAIVDNYLYCSSLYHLWDDTRTNSYMKAGGPDGTPINSSPFTKKYDVRTPYLYDGAYLRFGQVYRYDLNQPLAGQTPVAMIPVDLCKNGINGITTDGNYVYASTADGGAVENLTNEQVFDYNISIGIPANKDAIASVLNNPFQPGRFYKIGVATDTSVTFNDFTFGDAGYTDLYKNKSCYSNGWAVKDGWIYTVLSDAGHITTTPGVWNESSLYVLARINVDFSNPNIEVLNNSSDISYSLGTRIYKNCGTINLESPEGGKLYSFEVPDSTAVNPTVSVNLEINIGEQDWEKNTGYKYSTSGYTNPPAYNYIPISSGGLLPEDGNAFSYTNNGFNFKDRSVPCFIDQTFFDYEGLLHWSGNISYSGTFKNLPLYSKYV